MKSIGRITRMMCYAFVLFLGTMVCIAAQVQPLEERIKKPDKMKEMREEAAKTKREAAQRKALEQAKVKLEEEIAKINLPVDTTPLLTVKELSISGNTLIPTDELFKNMPLIYNTSNKPLHQAESIHLYDFRVLHDIIMEPGKARQLSSRTIQGFTQYILSVYQAKHYAGIYVYVPTDAMKEGKLLNDILSIKVLEAKVTSITIKTYDPNQQETEKGYLRRSVFEKWSPLKSGQVANEKKLDDFINLLNLNPDRYVSAVVSKGTEPETLAVGYNIYEANPWHYFLQVDNAGTKDIRWSPRVGIINTNLTGRDDRFTAVYQAPWEKGIEDKYSLYGNYDFPIMGPRLRLELYAGYSQFNVDGGEGINFLGHGYLYGGKLRYNAFQTNGWFFDLTTSLSREKSKVSSSIFSAILGSEVTMDLWGIGFDIHRRNDMSNTSITFDDIQSVGGSSQRKFWDSGTGTGARTNAERDFTIYTTAASHSQYLNPDKVQRLSGSLRWIVPTERLVPAKMTTFGGMYTVRGYKESSIVADGGTLASVQYEFDLVKYDASKESPEAKAMPENRKPYLRKLAPLAFFDYGRTKIKDKVAGEQGDQELSSIGVGTLVELGDNFSGAVYYGYPLESTDTTDKGDGRINVSLMMRW